MAEAASDQNHRNRSAAQVLRARESFALIAQISRLLNTDLDGESLSLCVRLCEAGVHPQALATVIREIKKEVSAIKAENGDQDDISHATV